MAKDPVQAASPAPPVKRVRKHFETDAERVLGVRTLKRIDPDEDFSDVDGDPRNEFALDGEESDRHYMWISDNADEIGERKGGIVPYRVEYHGEGTVSAQQHADQDKGSAIRKRGLVLMSCDKAKWQKRNRYELKQQLDMTRRMTRRRQRDIDFRANNDRGYSTSEFRDEMDNVQAEMRG